MGTYKIVKNADFSTGNVGKMDFVNKIFRRKINGALERNYIEFTRNSSTSKTPVDLSKSNAWKVKINFFNPAGSADTNPYYSVADHINKRGFYVTLIITYGGVVTALVWTANIQTLEPYSVKTKQDSISCGTITFDSVTEHTIELDIDFTTCSCTSFKFDGAAKNITSGTPGSSVVVFNNTATNTIAVGAYAQQDPISTVGLARPSFIQLSQNGKIELHHDFLGDDDIEIFTEKARGILLKKGAQIVRSVPISI